MNAIGSMMRATARVICVWFRRTMHLEWKENQVIRFDKVVILSKKREPKGKQARARSCQHLNFCFPSISTDWVPKKSAEKPVQLASTFSLFFSAALILVLSSFKNRAKIQMFSTQMELNLIRWHVRSALCTLQYSE